MLTHEQLRMKVLKLHTTDYSWDRLAEPMKSLKKAAVLIPLVVENGRIKVWLTKRSERVNTYQGQVSFPGGKKDPCDGNAVETAIREAYEEIGLQSSQVEVIGELLPRVSIHLILVTPIVGIVSKDFLPKPNGEVALAFQLPLDRFLSSNGHHSSVYETSFYKEYLHHFYDDVDGQNVETWGLTAQFAIELACGVFRKPPEFAFSLNGDINPDDPHQSLRMHLSTQWSHYNDDKSKL